MVIFWYFELYLNSEKISLGWQEYETPTYYETNEKLIYFCTDLFKDQNTNFINSNVNTNTNKSDEFSNYFNYWQISTVDSVVRKSNLKYLYLVNVEIIAKLIDFDL